MTAPASENTKTCTGKHGCGRALPTEAFSTNRRNPDNLNHACRECENARNRARRVANGAGAARPPRPDAPEGHAVCFGTGGCGQTLPLDQFGTSRGGKGRRLTHIRSLCNACHSPRSNAKVTLAQRWASALWGNYRMTPEDFEALLAFQGGGCALCLRPEAECSVQRARGERFRRVVVEHCHTDRVVRGLTCSWCNHAIGMVEQLPVHARANVASPDLLAYLADPPARRAGIGQSGQTRRFR